MTTDYDRGWRDGAASVRSAMRGSLLSSILLRGVVEAPQPSVTAPQKCLACLGMLEIGVPVRSAGMDAWSRPLYVHQVCPMPESAPTPEYPFNPYGAAPAAPVITDAPAAVERAVAGRRAGAANPWGSSSLDRRLPHRVPGAELGEYVMVHSDATGTPEVVRLAVPAPVRATHRDIDAEQQESDSHEG